MSTFNKNITSSKEAPTEKELADKEIYRTCLHEAAHAVVFSLAGVSVDSIELTPNIKSLLGRPRRRS